ncbi:hypothetical protein EU527_12495 [Candidatus Thorarchaeota archaeon]|nr:MAG: hypothetical protein EU527_12495 [Candidatus Thorarchaeota archaeon]
MNGAQYGQVILANCSNVTVSNGLFDHASAGVQLGYCTECTLENNIATSNVEYGFRLYSSPDCILTNNTASNNQIGFSFLRSSYCTLQNNTANGNEYGIYLRILSSRNLFFFNRLFNNSLSNARDDGSVNNWDNGTHGNYWDDYDGSGTYSIIGSAGSVDNYPYLYVQPPPPNGITTTTTTTTGITTTITTPPGVNDFDLVRLLLIIISICSGGIIVVAVILTIRERRVAINTISCSEEEIID